MAGKTEALAPFWLVRLLSDANAVLREPLEHARDVFVHIPVSLTGGPSCPSLRKLRAESKPHDGTIVTNKVNEMWGTDMTQTITVAEGRAYVFVAVEHANSEVVGIHAARSANRFEALEPVRQGVHRCFGSIAPGVARGLMLRHDHGSNYMSGDFQEEIECLGIEASPSFVREPQGNGVAERFIRTLKENLLWARTFDTIEELRAALVEFARHYNETWLVARHGNRTPAQVRAAQSQLDQNAMTDLKLVA
jgi:putative transposase